MNKEIYTLTEENIANSPLFQELLNVVDSKADIPYIEKDKVLMAPGVWNDCYYSKEEIIKAYNQTNWEDRYNSNLILDHQDQKFGEWIGEIKNRRLDEPTGFVYGDMFVYDPISAVKLKYGKPKTGISPKVTGEMKDKSMKNFTFNNFSVVINPAIKKAFINNSDGTRPVFFLDDEYGNAQVTDMETKRKELGMSVSEFYAVPRDPPSASKLPIFDASHVRNALARFNQVEGLTPEEKATAKNKIFTAAKKFNITVIEPKDKNKNSEVKSMGNEEEEKETDEGNEAQPTKSSEDAKLSELEEFTNFHNEFVKENSSASLEEVFNAFKKKKVPEEPKVDAPVEDKKEDKVPDAEMKAKETEASEMEELKAVVKTMAQEMKELVIKLETPERVTSTGNVAEMKQNQSADEQMMGFLKRM